ncbi:MAG: hypothetical protein R3B90_01805 [Planctomycetaceae bacterium]
MSTFRFAVRATLLLAWTLAALPQSASAAKTAAQIRAEIAKQQREFEQRSKALQSSTSARTGGSTSMEDAAARAKAAITGEPAPTNSQPTSTSRSSGNPASTSAGGSSRGTGKFTRSKAAYEVRRGDEYAWRVTMQNAPGEGANRWEGDLYLLGIYESVNNPGEVMLIGNLACYTQRSGQWVRSAEDDVRFQDHLRIGSTGVLQVNTEATDFTGRQRRLPLQMNVILETTELLFPSTPMFVEPNGDEHRGKQTAFLFGGSGYGVAPLTGDTYSLTKVEGESTNRPTIVSKRVLGFPNDGIGLAYSRTTTFDASQGMPIDSTLNYVEKVDADVRIDVSIRRLSGQDVVRARGAALAMHPVASWPTSLKRVEVPAGSWELAFPNVQREVRPGQVLAVAITYSMDGVRSVRTYRGTAIKVVDSETVLMRLDGSGEEREIDYRSLHLLK